jgi:transcriptional regulator with XRE-family HTH domain
MSTTVDDLETRLAERVRVEREARRWSIADLAERSGVSKAMISKIERREASPTASLLGRLSAAFGLTLSTLLSRAEGSAGRLVRRADQSSWVDPATGFHRTAISPPGSKTIELIHGELPPGAKIDYPAAAYAFIDQQIWMLKGTLTFIEGTTVHELHAGDCLALGTPADSSFENRGEMTNAYLVVVARRE